MADVLERVRATGLLPAGAPVVVLLSGGRDSVCLLDVAVRLAAPAGPRAARRLRPARRGGRRRGALPRAVRAPRRGADVQTRAAPRRGNLQAWARDVRLGSAARRRRARRRLATGHTATDQAETILYRLAASPGRRALLGMAPREGRLVRPLLG